MSRAILIVAILVLASCAREPEPSRSTAPSPKESTPPPSASAASTSTQNAPTPEKIPPAHDAPTTAAAYPPVSPPDPGQPGGLPDDRTPISEAPFTPTSAQGAANVVQIYYALLGQHRYEEAWKFWTQS